MQIEDEGLEQNRDCRLQLFASFICATLHLLQKTGVSPAFLSASFLIARLSSSNRSAFNSLRQIPSLVKQKSLSRVTDKPSQWQKFYSSGSSSIRKRKVSQHETRAFKESLLTQFTSLLPQRIHRSDTLLCHEIRSCRPIISVA